MNTLIARQLVFAERSVTKVIGVYTDEASALHAKARLCGEAGWAPSQVRLLAPGTAGTSRGANLLARQVEPESSGIFHTMLRAHATFGIAGFLLGVALWAWLRQYGPAFIASSPAMSLMAIAFFAGVGGLILAGLITLRPDHTVVIQALRDDLKQGRWGLVAHPINDEQVEEALGAFGPRSLRVGRTL